MKNKKTATIFLIFSFFLVSFVFSGCNLYQKPASKSPRLSLEVWGVFDDSSFSKKLLSSFANSNPKIKEVKYRKISDNAEEYERELIDAIASGKGPDIFYFENNWLPKHKDKIAPLPDSENYLISHKDEFVDVFYTDFVESSKNGKRDVYAMPLYNDTLALYYNKDMFNQAGIPYPPKTWDEVKEFTKKLTKIDEYGNITQSAIALGRSVEPGAINRSTDILSLLIMQNGGVMSQGENVNLSVAQQGGSNPGTAALNFYTQFARGDSDVYTWNSKMDYSIDSFRYRRVAMMINYAYMYDRLKRMDPKLNFDVAPVPQINLDRKVNYANYWGLAVTKNNDVPADSGLKNSDRINEAWKFVKYMTNKPTNRTDPNKIFLDASNRTAARKDLLEEQKSEAFRGVFAEQAYTSRSWRQPDELAVEEIMGEMINDVVSGNLDSDQALRAAVSRMNVLW